MHTHASTAHTQIDSEAVHSTGSEWWLAGWLLQQLQPRSLESVGEASGEEHDARASFSPAPNPPHLNRVPCLCSALDDAMHTSTQAALIATHSPHRQHNTQHLTTQHSVPACCVAAAVPRGLVNQGKFPSSVASKQQQQAAEPAEPQQQAASSTSNNQ